MTGYKFYTVVISNASVPTTASNVALNAYLGYYNGSSVTWTNNNYYWNAGSATSSYSFLSNAFTTYTYGINIVYTNGNSGTYTISGETNIRNHNNNLSFAGSYNVDNAYRTANYIAISTGQIASIPAFNSIYLFLGNSTFTYFPSFSGGKIYVYGTNQPN